MLLSLCEDSWGAGRVGVHILELMVMALQYKSDVVGVFF